MDIEMRKIKNFEDFNANGFCISPEHWRMPYAMFVKACKEAEELAKTCDDICVAIVNDEVHMKKYVLAETVPNSCEPKFVLYNAVETDEEDGEVRGYVRDKKGRFLLDQWVKYQPGELA